MKKINIYILVICLFLASMLISNDAGNNVIRCSGAGHYAVDDTGGQHWMSADESCPSFIDGAHY